MASSLRAKVLTSLDVRPALKIIWQSSPGLAIATGALLILQGLLPLASLYLLKLIVDAVEIGARSGAEGAGGGQGFGDVLTLVALAGGVALLGNFLQSASSYVSEVACRRCICRSPRR